VYTFSDWDERFEAGVDCFNREQFFEAHEVWEDLWHEVRDTDRSLLQALIQVAAGFYHDQCDNPRGMASQLRKAGEKLSRYPAIHRGIRVGDLLADVQRWEVDRRERGSALGRPPYPRITIDTKSPSS
jgi:predicted metal-dependent hydrolase